MSRTLKTTLVLLLVILIAGSATLFIVAITHPSASYDPGRVKIDIKFHTREQVLTCAYKVYGDSSQDKWVAKTLIKNVGKIPVYDFKIWYKVTGYTDWTSGEVYKEISPGETVRDFCWPSLDPDKMKAITTKTPADVVMKYTYRGLKEPVEDYEKIYLLGKNDFIFTSLKKDDIVTFADGFDNYNLLPAFITPNEETTKSFANSIAGGLETKTSDADAYQAFLRCFDALRAAGVKYIQEPAGFWAGTAAQYVQYPKETIDRKSGTCLDLAISMSALMEAVGVKSYVAIVPGHAIPVMEEPVSGKIWPIESTFIDKDYALSHFPGKTSPDVTAEECVVTAGEYLLKMKEEGTLLMVDPEYWWNAGVMPSW